MIPTDDDVSDESDEESLENELKQILADDNDVSEKSGEEEDLETASQLSENSEDEDELNRTSQKLDKLMEKLLGDDLEKDIAQSYKILKLYETTANVIKEVAVFIDAQQKAEKAYFENEAKLARSGPQT